MADTTSHPTNSGVANMDLGILFIGGDATVLQQTAIAKRAEESGFDSLYMAAPVASAFFFRHDRQRSPH